ncbi:MULTISPECIES: serine/threonine-protein kinase, partial [unclassified Streptomyces]|uniref:serine/threonine-protein kinase n=1 Tax=unclassified Streptomyces TaxID=2593676 RepID=UPI00114CC9FA
MKTAKAAKPGKAAAAAATPAASDATNPQEPGTGAVAGQPASPAGPPWQLPGYAYEGDLGAGPSARVVRARHEESDTPVAITYLSAAVAEDPAFRTAFRAEAEQLAALDSPYVARVYAYVEDGPHAAAVTELVDGAGLDALLRAKGATAPESALAVLKGSLLGLTAAHGAGVLHRAVGPANVLVTAEGAVKLADFGVAARGGDSAEPVVHPAGTAPEVWAGAPATAVSDLYAATATFAACLTGTMPYAAGTAEEPAVPHAEAPISDEQAPEPIRPLIARGLAQDPAERPQSAADFAAELEAVAVAAYGEDWEERGQRELAASVGLLSQSPSGPEVAAAALPPHAAHPQAAAAAAATAGAAAGP